MTAAAYPFKNLDQAQAVREATERVAGWDDTTQAQVALRMPDCAAKAGHKVADWVVSVETQRRDWETPAMAAERVALWVTLHAELYGRPPTERVIQRTTTPRDRHSW